MVFSSFTFLFMFLPAFLAVYFLSPGRIKNLVALIGSCVFYAWGAPRILPLLLLGCLIDFCLGRQFANASLSAGRKKALLIFGLLLNVSFLAYFKYANFFVAEFNGLLSLSGIPEFSWKKIALPIGISFYTFHKISYLVDVYNGRAQASRNLIDYLLYIALFPQLVAGPILRYYDISEQLRHRRVTLDDFSHGAFRFCVGLGKKILIADEMGKVADNVFHFSAASSPGTVYLWLGLIAYAYQIYFDFSAYSDMAIGLGRMLGFRFLENFNMPYISKNITEFWRRWHISLSNWMRDYLYIPLGGNRVPAWRNYINLWLVFLLSGLWHGASWNFILWGMFHGSFLTFDKLFWLKYSQKLPRVFNVAITFLVILFSWVLFRSENFSDALSFFHGLFQFTPAALFSDHVAPAQIIHYRGVFIFCVASILVFAPALWPKFEKLGQRIQELPSKSSVAFGRYSLAVALFVLAILNLSSNDFSPFLYFKF